MGNKHAMVVARATALVSNAEGDDGPHSVLPQEIIVHILSFLHPRDLAPISRLSRKWNQIANDSYLWKTVAQRLGSDEFGNRCWLSAPASSEGINYKHLVRVFFAPEPALTCALQLHGMTGRVYSIDWAQNLLLAVSSDSKLHIYDLDGPISAAQTKKKKRPKKLTATAHINSRSPWMMCCALSPSSALAASGYLDNCISIYSIFTKTCVAELSGHGAYISSMKWLCNEENRIISSSGDSTVAIWDIPTRQIIVRLGSFTQDVFSVDATDNRQLIAAVGCDLSLQLFDCRAFMNTKPTTTAAVATIPAVIAVPRTIHSQDINSVRFSPNGNAVALASEEGTVSIYDVRRVEPIPLKVVRNQPGPLSSLAFSKSGKSLYVGSRTGVLLTISTVKDMVMVENDHSDEISSVVRAPSLNWVATGGWDRRVLVWNHESAVD